MIAGIEDQLEKHTIRAPFDGYIVAESHGKRPMAARGDLVATVAELDEVDVEIQVLENYIPHVRVGDEVRLEITSLPTEILTRPRGRNRSAGRFADAEFPSPRAA